MDAPGVGAGQRFGSAFDVGIDGARVGDELAARGTRDGETITLTGVDRDWAVRAIAALGRAAKAIGEDDEYDRIRQMLSDADPDSVATLLD